MSNIWTAASEGDLVRVQHLISSGIHPNIADDNSYTPIHAAASWGHVEILKYLLELGGDINILDGDGETPLFLVETAEMARVVVGLGGNPELRNMEGLSPAQSLQEDYPHIALYLRSLTGEPTPAYVPTLTYSDSMEEDDQNESNTSTNSNIPLDTLDESTDSLIFRVRMIMEASERGEIDSDEADEQLRKLVEEVVRGQVEEGRKIGEGMEVEDPNSGSGSVRERDETIAEGDEGQGKRRRDEDEPAR